MLRYGDIEGRRDVISESPKQIMALVFWMNQKPA